MMQRFSKYILCINVIFAGRKYKENMAEHYTSKHGIVGRSQAELFMAFTDLRNFKQMVPPDKQVAIEADFDSLTATAQGMSISVRVAERHPYDLIVIEDKDAPIHFSVKVHFDDGGAGRTDFWIEADAELNGIMKLMIGGKIREALDKVVDGLVEASAKF